LVSWWSGNGHPDDLLGGNNGTLRSNATYAPGEAGQAFSLDGASDGVVIGNPSNLQLQNFTIEAWVKRKNAGIIGFGPYHVGGIFTYSTGGYGFGISDDGHLLLSKVWVGGVNSTLTVTDTNWHHVAVTKSGSTVIFYIDGNADTPISYDPGFRFSTRASVGDNPDNPGMGFYGLIDELSIYNRPLSQTEVQSVVTAGAQGKCVPPPPPPVGQFVNGSFELPALAPGATPALPAGSTIMTGWTVGNDGVVSMVNGEFFGASPVDGSQQVAFNGGNGPVGGSILQTFSTTVGQTYTVSFFVGRAGSGGGTMSVYAEVTSSNGQVLGSLAATGPVAPGYSSPQSFTFTATTETATLTFRDTSSATVAVDLMLDNVSVTPLANCASVSHGLVRACPKRARFRRIIIKRHAQV
jgi:hypothetical protein